MPENPHSRIVITGHRLRQAATGGNENPAAPVRMTRGMQRRYNAGRRPG